MLNKKIFVLTILFVLIASLGIISATDLQNNDTATIADHSSTTNDYTIQADNTKSDTIKTEKQIKKQNIETNKKEKETKSVTNYEQLYYNLTDPTTDDLTISLEGTDEEYVITKNITVNEAIKNLKIDGNGKIIDGQNNYQFLIINHECNLTLNNITIQNCLADQEGLVFQIATEGGAIHQKGGNLNINNSQFLSNEAFTFGGAIYYNSSNENNVVNIFHSTFDSNRANDGGALFISHTGNITIDDSTITNNKALTGSALTILNEYAFEVNDIVPGESEPSFELLESSTNVTINNSIIDSNGYVDDTKIDYDTLYHDAYTRVGAVVIELVDKITIQNSKFNNNIAEMGGALAVAYNNELLIDNSTFDSNGIPTEYYKYDVPSQGGALYLMTNGTTKITYTNFTNNTATEGSAIYYKEMEIPNNNVEPVEVEPGRGIEIQESIPSLTINNSIIDSNGYIVENPIAQDGDEKYYCSETGAITIEGIKQISVQNSKFKNNIGRDGGAILADDYDDLLIDNSTFDSNGIPKEYYKYGLTSEGGALLLRTNGTTKITYTNLTNNTASGGSAIYCEYYEPVAPVEPGEVVSRGTKIQESTSSLLINHSIIDSNGYIDESLIDQYQNGLYPCSEAGAITIEGIKQISVLNSTFENNIGLEGEAIIAMDYDDLLISDSSFDNNSLPLEYIDYELFAEAGAVGLFPNGNTTITASNFTNNGAAAGSAIFCMGLNEECNFNISDSLFESNIGLMGGTLYLQNLNASVTNSNFTNNTVFLYENSFIGNIGLVIYSKDTTLFINTTNFIGNGLPENLTEDDVEEILTGSGIVFCQGENDVTIDNSNFQSNRGLGLGGIISFVGTYKEYPSTQQEISPKLSAIDYVPKEKDYQYGDEIQYHTNSTLRINNTKFEDNTITCNAEKTEEGNYVMPTMGYVIVTQGNTIIDNSDFINNKVINLFENSNEMENEFYYSTGPILFYKEDYNITCNVTNSNFMFNSPANFIGKDNRIILNHTTHIGTDIVMDDGYIPDFGDVMIYVDGSNQGTYYQLVSDNNDVYVKDLTLSDEYLIKMVVNQTSQSKYYANQTFNNNTYYFRIPQEFILSVNATSPITIDDDTTIKGQLYFTKNNGDKYVFPDEDVYLYINGTYVAKTKTNATGNYEFTYTTTSVGSQEVLVTVNTSPTLPTITNTTTFDVIKRDSIINIDVKNITVGQKSKITITLTNTKNKKISDADVTFLIDNQEITRKTDKNGIITYECEITTTGLQYIYASFDGDYSHFGSSNSTTFMIYQLNSSIQLTAPNTTLYEETSIRGKLIDSNGKAIPNAPITVYIDELTINKETDENGEFICNYTPNTPNVKYIEVIYAGNNTYKNSANTTSFQVAKLNTTTIATPTTTTIGNLTYQVIVTDKNEKIVNSGRIVIYDEKGRAVATQTVKSTITTLTISDITSGTYKFNIKYEENSIYYSSNTTNTVTIIPKANIDIEILNNTQGNVQMEFYVTNERKEVLKQQEVTITLPNGTTIKQKTDNKGKITITDKTATAGTKNVVATITTTDKIIGATKTKNVHIVKDYEEVITHETINNINNTINEITNILNNLTRETEKDTTTTIDKTTVIKAIAQNGTIGNTKVGVTLENELTKPIINGAITIKNDKGEIIGTGTTDKKGVVVIPVKTVNGEQKVTVIYAGNKTYKPANSTISITAYKNNVTVIVDAVTGIVGEEITLTAHLTDNNKKPVNGGNLVFKVNGKTLRTDGRFDSDAPAWKFKVENGLVTITIEADIYLRNAKTLTASYSGTYQYNEAKSNTVVAQIKKRNAQISISTTPRIQKSYQTIQFIAKVKDVTPNTKNSKMIYTNTKVIFKINGKTLKDAQGNTIQVAVNKDGIATYNYVVPAGMSAIKKNGEMREYNVSCIFVSDAFYPDTRDETFFYVERSPVTININKVTVNKNNRLSINANIKDTKGNNVIGTNDVSIKINGKTYINSTTNKTAVFQVNDGKINLKNIPISKNINIKTVTIVTGARQAYLGQKNETSNIIKV